MSHQARIAGANYTTAVCGHPVRPDEPHGVFLDELVCQRCGEEFAALLRQAVHAGLLRPMEELGL